MGNGTIPARADLQTIDQTWFNVLRTALDQDFVPRDASGVVTDIAGSLGSSSVAWLAAYLDSLKLRSNGNLITLQSPTGLAVSFTIKLPAALPGSGTKFFTIDSAGAVSIVYDVDGTSIERSGTDIRVKALGITEALLANNSVSQGKLGAQLTGISASSSTFTTTNTTATDVVTASAFTTTGRYVLVKLQPDGSLESYIGTSNSISVPKSTFILLRDGAEIARFVVGGVTSGDATFIPPSSFCYLDTGATAASHVYKLQVFGNSVNTTTYVTNTKLIGYEL